MFATLFSCLAAAALLLLSSFLPIFAQTLYTPYALLQFYFGISMLAAIAPWGWTVVLMVGKQRAALQAALHDAKAHRMAGLTFAIAVIGLVISSQRLLGDLLTFAICLVFAGMIIDSLHTTILRLQACHSAEGLAGWLISRMDRAARKHDNQTLLKSFDMLFSQPLSYIKAGDVSALKLALTQIESSLDVIIRSLSMLSMPKRLEENGHVLDRYATTEALIAKRLSWCVRAACEAKIPAALEDIVRLYGRTFLTFHNRHDSLGQVTLFSLSQSMQRSGTPEEQVERDLEVSAAFSEIVKTIIDRTVERGIADSSTIFKLLKTLDTYLKESFRINKSINPALLMQPFAEIGNMLAAPKYASLPDRTNILSELKRLLTQFSVLETVASRLDIPAETDTAASYKEDLPFRA